MVHLLYVPNGPVLIGALRQEFEYSITGTQQTLAADGEFVAKPRTIDGFFIDRFEWPNRLKDETGASQSPKVRVTHAVAVDYLEPDVVITKDKKAVVLHDIYLENITNIEDVFKNRKRSDGHYYVVDFTLAEIKELKVRERKDKLTNKNVYPHRFPSKFEIFTVPTLDEYLKMINGLNYSTGKNIGVYLEIKAPEFYARYGIDSAKIVYDVLVDNEFFDNKKKLIIQCFDFATLERLRNNFFVTVPLIYLKSEKDAFDFSLEGIDKTLAYMKSIVDGLGVSIDDIFTVNNNRVSGVSNLYSRLKSHRLLIHVYTLRKDSLPLYISSFKSLHELLFDKYPVNGVFSDFPDLTRKYRDLFYNCS